MSNWEAFLTKRGYKVKVDIINGIVNIDLFEGNKASLAKLLSDVQEIQKFVIIVHPEALLIKILKKKWYKFW